MAETSILFRQQVLHPVAITGANWTSVPNRMAIFDTSGASRTVTPDASPQKGDTFGVYLKTQSSNYTVTVTGLDTLYIAGDYVEYEYDGSNWLKVIDKLHPHICRLARSTAQAVTISTETQMQFGTTVFDTASLADLANYRIAIRRSGKYLVGGQIGWTMVDATRIQILIKLAGTDTIIGDISAGASTGHRILVSKPLELSAGDLLTMSIFQSASTTNTQTAIYDRPELYVIEQR